MNVRIAHQIPLLGHPTATAQATESHLPDSTTVVIGTQDPDAPNQLEIDIVEGSESDEPELVIRLRGRGKLCVVPSAANAIRIRSVRY